jgi:hypothetical protein
LGIPATDGPKIEETFIVHVGDHEADFVHVAGEHNPRRTLFVYYRERVPMEITPSALGESFGLLDPHPRRFFLKPGRTNGGQKLH